jgi:chromosome segregation ATPase
LVELDKTLEDIKVKGNRKNEDVGSCLKALGECLSRRERLKVSEVRREFTGMSTDLSNLQVELKKKMIRAMLDQKEIERQQNSNKDLQGQLTELRRKLARETREVGCGTEQIGNCKGS